MGMPNAEQVQFLVVGANAIVGTGAIVNASDLVAGFGYTHGTGAHTSQLDGSVDGNIWSKIADLDMDKQGAIPSHYRFVRIQTTVIGALGTSECWYHGKS